MVNTNDAKEASREAPLPSQEELGSRLVTLKAQAFDLQLEVNRLTAIYNQLYQQIVQTSEALRELRGE